MSKQFITMKTAPLIRGKLKCECCGDHLFGYIWHVVIHGENGNIYVHEGCLMRALKNKWPSVMKSTKGEE